MDFLQTSDAPLFLLTVTAHKSRTSTRRECLEVW
jgi:hypothetical protein